MAKEDLAIAANPRKSGTSYAPSEQLAEGSAATGSLGQDDRGPQAGIERTSANRAAQDAAWEERARESLGPSAVFPLGEDNDAYAAFFTGASYLAPLTGAGADVSASNVTFEPGCRNHWHVHHGSGQLLLVTGGHGRYQEWGRAVRELAPGDVVSIPVGVKHWHGAAPNSWFSHVAVSAPVEGASTEWLEPVSDKPAS